MGLSHSTSINVQTRKLREKHIVPANVSVWSVSLLLPAWKFLTKSIESRFIVSLISLICFRVVSVSVQK